MSIQSIGLRAYSDAVAQFNKVDNSLKRGNPVKQENLFAKTLDMSLTRDSVDKPETGVSAQADFIQYPSEKHVPVTRPNSFVETVADSLNRVNTLQMAKAQAIEDFASGRSQNVHELMITMQKSSLAMKMTSAVRSKVLEAYKEISRMTF